MTKPSHFLSETNPTAAVKNKKNWHTVKLKPLSSLHYLEPDGWSVQ